LQKNAESVHENRFSHIVKYFAVTNAITREVFQLICLIFQLTQKNDQNQLFFELNRTI